MASGEFKSEKIKQVIECAMRALSGEEADNTLTDRNKTIHVEQLALDIPKKINRQALQQLRGKTDSEALQMRFHNNPLHKKISPSNHQAASLFDQIETLRAEVIGCRHLPGVSDNINHYQTEQFVKRNLHQDFNPSQINDAIAILLREQLMSQPLPKTVEDAISPWRPLLEDKILPHVSSLKQALDNQQSFAETIFNLFDDLNIDISFDIGEEKKSKKTDQDAVPDASDDTEETDNTASSQTTNDDQEGEEEETQEPEPDYSSKLDGDSEESNVTLQNGSPPFANTAFGEYKIYSKAYDQTIVANHYCSASQLSHLRQQLDNQLDKYQGLVAVLANRLQRRLMALQRRHWQFDLDEGLLDPARLTRVITDPVYPLSYMQESDTVFRDTVVTLLIDNSGSMRGWPITVAAISADILARTLERCGVKVEILGFTTQGWKGGMSRESWVEAGQPENPGRLNDLLHIIYKHADQPWRQARKNLGLMLHGGLLKENIDGEALLWAHQRLIARPEDRRILMVISDGEPVDDATLTANSGHYLEQHLKRVVTSIENNSPVELLAIGIGHDVTQYYQRAAMINDVDDLGSTMIQELSELFDEPSISLKTQAYG